MIQRDRYAVELEDGERRLRMHAVLLPEVTITGQLPRRLYTDHNDRGSPEYPNYYLNDRVLMAYHCAARRRNGKCRPGALMEVFAWSLASFDHGGRWTPEHSSYPESTPQSLQSIWENGCESVLTAPAGDTTASFRIWDLLKAAREYAETQYSEDLDHHAK